MVVPFWANDVDVLWRNGGAREFLPVIGEPLNAVLNSLTRFIIILCIVLSVYYHSWAWLIYVGVPAIVLIMLAHKHFGDDSGRVSAEEKKRIRVKKLFYDEDDSDLIPPLHRDVDVVVSNSVRRLAPTLDNPYANPNPTDMQTGSIVLPPEDPTDIRVQAATFSAGSDGIIPDERDVWGRNDAGGLTFHTVAGAPYGDPLGEFRAFLFKEMDKPTMKEAHGTFGPVHRDLRHVPRRPPYPYLPGN